jgi:lysophospholipid acyltransferase (LPLAT)-like uncharacterized protein
VKAFLRAPAVQAVLGLILAGYLKLTLSTLRWQVEGGEVPEGIWARGGPVICCFWHGRIALTPTSWPHDRVRAGAAQAPRALISLSPDGAFIAGAMARLGFPAIRGSSVKASDTAKPKGSVAAFREALRWLAAGGGLAITPDGPRGPAERMADGAMKLAELSGAPIILLGLACEPAIRLKSWDRTAIPLPFGRAARVWAGPFLADETPREVLEARLSAVTARAEALVARDLAA